MPVASCCEPPRYESPGRLLGGNDTAPPAVQQSSFGQEIRKPRRTFHVNLSSFTLYNFNRIFIFLFFSRSCL